MKDRTGHRLLGHDLQALAARYEQRDDVPAAQRAVWHRRGRRPAITAQCLGASATDATPLRLLEALGGDGGPVGDLRGTSARRYGDYVHDHVYPSPRTLVRVARFFALDVYGAAHLLLKGAWESRVGHLPGATGTLAQRLRDPTLAERARVGFAPDLDAPWGELTAQGFVPGEERWERSALEALLGDMLLHEMQHLAIDAQEAQWYADQKRKERRVVLEGDEAARREDVVLQVRFTRARHEAEEVGMELERARLRAEELRRRFALRFGAMEHDVLRLTVERDGLLYRIELKQRAPSLTAEALEAEVAAEEARELAELEARRLDAAPPELPRPEVDGRGRPLSEAELQAIRARARRTLLQIRFLVHPDRLAQDPAYAAMTPSARRQIDEFCLRVLAVRTEELGRVASDVFRDLRDPDVLAELLEQARELLATAGLDVDVSLVPQGSTLAERAAWFARALRFLEGDRVLARRELLKLSADPALRRMAAALGDEAAGRRVLAGLRSDIARLQTECERARTALAALFSAAA